MTQVKTQAPVEVLEGVIEEILGGDAEPQLGKAIQIELGRKLSHILLNPTMLVPIEVDEDGTTVCAPYLIFEDPRDGLVEAYRLQSPDGEINVEQEFSDLLRTIGDSAFNLGDDETPIELALVAKSDETIEALQALGFRKIESHCMGVQHCRRPYTKSYTSCVTVWDEALDWCESWALGRSPIGDPILDRINSAPPSRLRMLEMFV